MSINELTPQERLNKFYEYVEEKDYEKLMKLACTAWFALISIGAWLLVSIVMGTVNVLAWVWYIQWLFIVLIVFVGHLGYNTCMFLLSDKGQEYFIQQAKRIFLKKKD